MGSQTVGHDWVTFTSSHQNGNLWESSCWWIFPGALPPTSLSLPVVWATAILRLLRRSSKTPVGLAQFPRSHCLALSPSAWETLCVPSKSEVSVSAVLQSVCTQTPLAFKARGCSSWCQPSSWEAGVGLRTLTPVGEPLWYSYFPVCGSPTQWRENLIISLKHPSCCLNVASLDVEYLFW